jgi:hypothetical protein
MADTSAATKPYARDAGENEILHAANYENYGNGLVIPILMP